jgi:hypothetical protein
MLVQPGRGPNVCPKTQKPWPHTLRTSRIKRRVIYGSGHGPKKQPRARPAREVALCAQCIFDQVS